MGKNWGMIKYFIFAPLARPLNFFKYGGGFAGVWSALNVLDSGSHQPFIEAYFAYLSMKYLPPTGLEDIALPILFGASFAAVSWRANV